MDAISRIDARLIPAACSAWAAALLALATSWPAAAALAVPFGVVAWWRRSLPAALGAVSATAVAVAVLLLGIHTAELASCDSSAQLRARVLEDPAPGGLAARYESRTRVSVVALKCGVNSWRAASGTVVVLGDVDEVVRDGAVALQGTLQPISTVGTDIALLFDAQVTSWARPSGIHGVVGRWRGTFLDQTSQLSDAGVGLVPGIALGDDSALPEWLDTAMKRSSLSHLTAVSGSHVVLVMALVGALAIRAPARIQAAAILVVLGALVLVVGPEASVVRAAAMGVVGVVALARGRQPHALAALAVGVTVLLVVEPTRAASYGFALSAAASAALVVGVPLVVRHIDPTRPRTRVMAAWIAVPVLAQLATAPILVLFQPAVSLWGVGANLAVAPVVPLTTLAALGAFLLQGVPSLAHPLLIAADLGARWISGVAVAVSRAPHSTLAWPAGIGGAVLLVAVEALLLWGAVRAAAFALGGAVLVIVVTAFAVTIGRDEWDVWQCDVGQGAATIVNAGAANAVLIDVGSADSGVERCLKRAGVRHISLLVLTHPHEDHVGNLAAVLAAVPVERAIVSPQEGQTAAAVLRELASAEVPVTTGTAGIEGTAGEVSWRVLWPKNGEVPADTNDASVVTQLELSDATVLALGDLGSEGQLGLLHAAGPDAVRSDVVVAAHHGSSDQSPQLVRAIASSVAIFPVGPNSYGHPTDAALHLYGENETQIYRTDHDGDVVLDLVLVGRQ